MQMTDFPPLETPPPPPPPQPAGNRRLVYIGLGVLVLLLVCGGLGAIAWFEQFDISLALHRGVLFEFIHGDQFEIPSRLDI